MCFQLAIKAGDSLAVCCMLRLDPRRVMAESSLPLDHPPQPGDLYLFQLNGLAEGGEELSPEGRGGTGTFPNVSHMLQMRKDGESSTQARGYHIPA